MGNAKFKQEGLFDQKHHFKNPLLTIMPISFTNITISATLQEPQIYKQIPAFENWDNRFLLGDSFLFGSFCYLRSFCLPDSLFLMYLSTNLLILLGKMFSWKIFFCLIFGSSLGYFSLLSHLYIQLLISPDLSTYFRPSFKWVRPNATDTYS